MQDWICKILVLIFFISPSASYAAEEINDMETILSKFYETVKEFHGTDYVDSRKSGFAFFSTLALLEFFMSKSMEAGYAGLTRSEVHLERAPTYEVYLAVKEARVASGFSFFKSLCELKEKNEPLFNEIVEAQLFASRGGKNALSNAHRFHAKERFINEPRIAYQRANLHMFKFFESRSSEFLALCRNQELDCNFFDPTRIPQQWNEFRKMHFSHLDIRRLRYILPLLQIVEDSFLKRDTALQFILVKSRGENDISALNEDVLQYIFKMIVY